MNSHDYSQYTLSELRIALTHVDESDTGRIRALEKEISLRDGNEEKEHSKRRALHRKAVSMLASPPRAVPFALLVRSYFGGVSSVIGWSMLAFGTIFFWAFTAQSDIVSSLQFLGEKRTVSGIVQFAKETNASENDEEVFRIGYAYGVGTEIFTGESYLNGILHHEGDSVTVEYLISKPVVSRLQGGRKALFGSWAVAVAVLPLIGLVIVLFVWRSARRYHRLLQQGSLGFGTLISSEPTNVTVNDRQQYKYTFEFVASDSKKYHAIIKTHEHERVEDEEEEMLLYLPSKPEESVLLDEMPSKPIISPDGNFALSAGARAKAIFSLILPVATIVGNVLYLIFA